MDTENKDMKKSELKARFNSLKVCEQDPTILEGKVIIHDFEESWNGQVISEEVCRENMETLIGKRIVCRYIPSEYNNGVDALTDHEEAIGKDREGNDIIVTNTTAIGFIKDVYIDEYGTDKDGKVKKALYGNVVLWNDDKYKNVVGLLQEWLNRGVDIHMSVEYLYCNYNVFDGIEYLMSPIVYVAHTLLNSEQRGEYAEVLPAYDCSSLISINEKKQWNKAINKLYKTSNKKTKDIDNKSKNDKSKKKETNLDLDINNKKEKGDNDMKDKEKKTFKKVCEMSFDDIRSGIYESLKASLTEDEYYDCWITDCYDDHFILVKYDYNNDCCKYYDVKYEKGKEDGVVIDLQSRKEVYLYTEWKEIPDVKIVLNKKNEKIKELEGNIKSLNKKIEDTKKEKDVTVEKFNDLTDKITSLNAKVQELEPLAEKYSEEQYQKSLNEAKDFYKDKFVSINSLNLFEKEETQELIKKTIDKDSEVSQKAKFSLNDLIVTNVAKPIKDDEEDSVNLNSVQNTKENKDLIDNVSEFESFYGFSKK